MPFSQRKWVDSQAIPHATPHLPIRHEVDLTPASKNRRFEASNSARRFVANSAHMSLYRIAPERLQPVAQTSFAAEKLLERKDLRRHWYPMFTASLDTNTGDLPSSTIL